ncbi:unnamed protein product [Cochlearia groenlandica]
MVKKNCDLCGGAARMYCESDQASLCFNCDGKVHGANFLVAKHTRCLLCATCHSLTPWKANGPRVGPTFSVCDSCFVTKNSAKVCSGSNRVSTEINIGLDDGAESYDEEEEEEEEVEEAENQVVPWTAAAAVEQRPCCSSSSESGSVIVKRPIDFCDEEEEVEESKYSRPFKRQSRDETAFKINGV